MSRWVDQRFDTDNVQTQVCVSMPGCFSLIQNLQDKDPDPVDERDNKNSFCGQIAMGVDIDGKQDHIYEKTKGSDGREHFFIIDKKIKEIEEFTRWSRIEVNNDQAKQGS